MPKMIKSDWVQELPGEAGGQCRFTLWHRLCRGTGFVGAQGKDTGHSGAGQGVHCRLEAETRDASVEQRPLGSRGVAGDSNPLPIQSASVHPGSCTNISPRSLKGGRGGATHQLLNIVYLGCCLCGVGYACEKRNNEKPSWKAPEDGDSHSGLAFILGGV
jgi:hypothetical protein